MYKVVDLMEEYDLELISGNLGIEQEIEKSQVSRPGLELAGLFDFYEYDRIQVLGSKEVTFFGWLNDTDKDIRIRMLFEKNPPAFIFSRNAEIPEIFRKYSSEFQDIGFEYVKKEFATTKIVEITIEHLTGKERL